MKDSTYIELADKQLRKFERDEDLIQEVLLKIYLNLNKFNSKKGTFQAFVNVIHNRVKIDLFRKVKNTEHITNVFSEFNQDSTNGSGFDDVYNPMVGSLISDEPSPEDKLIALEKRDSLLKALKMISPQRAKAIYLYYFRQMSTIEVAEELDLEVTTVRGYLKKGREDLKKHLK